ncbi:Asp23/Gls24 family envelope stress response protein [Streptomyces tropicalis]|uniref:Asp23/Gls24 family envelope stress response protein n=1 Tax=Streptomyces tropicalis TaxID=3034234 RepID=A0ABT6A3K6_9ACTN|nr:Asp23/Gls24 family envelope stress response protein [Streptomyces tropicalis]MDF3299235.1 Asp23/Gls24 family envelope stress response protein [Streptomyces tropicalis]
MTGQDGLTQALANAVREVPGVAFLQPGMTHLLRSGHGGTGAGGASSAGLRVSRGGPGGAWRVEVRIVTLSGARAADVARAAGSAARACLASHGPAGEAQIRVTVTGTV